MDDILITGYDPHEADNIIDQLGNVFALKILGQVHHFLGIRVTRDNSGGIHLC